MSLLKTDSGVDQAAGPNLTPLIDMLFLLIVFFLVTSVFVQEEIDHEVQLPTSRQSETLTRPASPLIINVRRDGTIIMGAVPVGADELEEKLSLIYSQEPGRPVVVRGDRRVVLQQCVKVMDVLKRVGFAKFTIECQK